jgi:hypothetical protein
MQFTGTGERLSANCVERSAALIGCEPAALRAVIEVEAAGSGFDAKARPKMLFEPHLFYAGLSGPARAQALAQGLAYKRWGEKPYPRTSEENYRRLALAMRLDEDAALRACSWGLPQILGANHAKAGYSGAADMVADMLTGENAQIEAMARFIIASNLAKPLRERNWAAFARGYNGPGYAKNAYDKKLASAFARFARARAPQLSPPRDEVDDARVFFVQERLRALGYFEVGKIDGLWGSRTRGALLAFKADNGLPLNEAIDEHAILALSGADPRAVDPVRALATPEEVAASSATAASARRSKFGAALAGFCASMSGALWGTLESFGSAASLLAPIRDVVRDAPPWLWFVAATVVAYSIWRSADQTETRLVEDYRAGKKP